APAGRRSHPRARGRRSRDRRRRAMTTVVVGAARGIGEAVARRLATEPWAGKVVLADLLLDETAAVAADLAAAGHDVEALPVDLRDDESIAELVARTREADRVALVAGIF